MVFINCQAVITRQSARYHGAVIRLINVHDPSDSDVSKLCIEGDTPSFSAHSPGVYIKATSIYCANSYYRMVLRTS